MGSGYPTSPLTWDLVTPPLYYWHIWWSLLFTWGPTLPQPPLVLTPSGGHWNMYGWLEDGTHRTGMLSCRFPINPFFNICVSWSFTSEVAFIFVHCKSLQESSSSAWSLWASSFEKNLESRSNFWPAVGSCRDGTRNHCIVQLCGTIFLKLS